MREEEFKKEIQRKLKDELIDYEILINENLVYKVIVNDKGEYRPEKPRKPKRGYYSFQTDLMIKQNILPLVVIETKIRSFSTHDVLTYSIKAQKHKEIYPYMRYGLLIGNSNVVYNRFFTHNSGFDFALAIKDIETESISKLIQVINSQIESAKKLLDVIKERNNVVLFNTIIEIEKKK